MPRRLVPKQLQIKFKRLINQLILDLGEKITVIQESPDFVRCPNCIWDSINRKSSNVRDVSFTIPKIVFAGTSEERTISPIAFNVGRCPVCIGEGQLFTNKSICVRALVNFPSGRDSSGSFVDFPAGKEGKNFVVIKANVCHYELFRKNTTFLIKNGVRCEKVSPPIVRGLGGGGDNEAVVEMWLETVEIGESISNEHRDPDVADPRRKIRGSTLRPVLTGQLKGRNS